MNPSLHRDRGGGLPLLGRPEHPGIAATPTAPGAFLGLSRRLPLRRPPVAKHQVAQRIARGESKLALVVGLVMVAHAIRVGRAVSAIAVASHLPDRQASNVWRGSTPKPASAERAAQGFGCWRLCRSETMGPVPIPVTEPLVSRQCSSFKAAKAGVECWAKRHAARIPAEAELQPPPISAEG